MISFFVPIVAAFVGGYLAILAVYMLLMFTMTRLGRKVLMQNDRASTTYTVLLCGTWLAASFAGAWVCGGFAPFGLYGTRAFPIVLAGVIVAILLRNLRQLPGQQSPAASLAVFATVVLGTAGGLFVRHAL